LRRINNLLESKLGFGIITGNIFLLFFLLFFLEIKSCFQATMALILGMVYATTFTFLLRKVSVQMWIFKKRFLFVIIFFFLLIWISKLSSVIRRIFRSYSISDNSSSDRRCQNNHQKNLVKTGLSKTAFLFLFPFLSFPQKRESRSKFLRRKN